MDAFMFIKMANPPGLTSNSPYHTYLRGEFFIDVWSTGRWQIKVYDETYKGTTLEEFLYYLPLVNGPDVAFDFGIVRYTNNHLGGDAPMEFLVRDIPLRNRIAENVKSSVRL